MTIGDGIPTDPFAVETLQVTFPDNTKTDLELKNENIERQMLRRKNQLSIDENI